ncbi:uncharacterized protein TRIREDRAFT_105407 [Trichoderma reesei QM6a]|jgi:hypothetical protein|uniref:Predicted protein n=2 Tax=Hypocrea jecorina TaxID=51453 RepID=G0REH0_HYPJQ|nr:uncharacterized protein TRIREDRAFT_105407 [Trichoderma reesei QM6a]EGR50363.1 predicted protein [Trichoderma reesei QM6a]ETS03771.1 hypothetical protein M419DRAFT_74058 [Trichoderma reesei RUT C-30]
MLDDSFPTYRLHSSEDPLQTGLFYTYNGSDPVRAYNLQRPAPSSSPNQYAVALFDAHYPSVIYGEVLVKPEWQQPTLSAAEIRNQNGTVPAPVPITPDAFSVLLYNPDQSIVVKRSAGGWNRADSWGFEMPERTFKLPSASRLDQELGSNDVSDLSPKIMFHWKRDGRLNRDMTCYMSGKSVGGKKSKEPDITVAMYRSQKHGDALCIYEPNMARVEVEDRKGLEVVLLLSAVVVRDLHFAPRQDPFNISGTAAAGVLNGKGRRGSRPLASSSSPSDPTLVSGALGGTPSPVQATHTPPLRPSPASNVAKQTEIDAETRRLQAMVAEEERQRRARLAREEEERTRRMLRQEEEARRRQKQAEIDAETERLRREYGVQVPPARPSPPSQRPSPPSQRPSGTAAMSGALSGGSSWYGPPVVNNLQPPPPPPPRPSSVGPQSVPQQQGGRHKPGPYSGLAGARASAINLFGGGKTEEEKRKKMKKKHSVFF